MKGFFGTFAYYTVALLSLAYMATGGLQGIIPGSCEQIPLEGKYIWLPQTVSEVFENSIVNLHFRTIRAKDISLYGYVEGGRIRDMDCGRSENYDYEVWMSDLNAIELATSDNPITTFQNLRRQGQIKIEANGEQNQHRLDAASVLEEQDTEAVPQSIQDFFESIHTADILLFLTP